MAAKYVIIQTHALIADKMMGLKKIQIINVHAKKRHFNQINFV